MEYLSTILVSLILMLMVTLIIRSMLQKRKNGKCTKGCSDCGSCSICYSKAALVEAYHNDHDN